MRSIVFYSAMNAQSSNCGKINADYINRINRVVDYVEAHLDEDLALEQLARIACFSRFHFHRIFQTVTGECLAAAVQRIRLDKAAAMLHNNSGSSITDIALACGFASSASFANAFKRRFGISASRYKYEKRSFTERSYIRLPDENTDSLDIHIGQNRGKLSYFIKGNGYKRRVDVVDLPPWTVAYIRSTGPYKGDSRLFERLWSKLAGWAAPRGLLNKKDSVCLTLCHDDPEITMEDKLRVSVCIGIDATTATAGEVGKMKLPGGKYAVCRFLLGPNDYPSAWGWMYGVWLPASGYQLADRIAFEWVPRQKLPGEDDKMLVDICIPVKIDDNS